MKQATANRPKSGRRSAKSANLPDVLKMRLCPMLLLGEKSIPVSEALRRAGKDPVTNHGEEFAKKLAAALNAVRDQILLDAWGDGQYVIFTKDWHRSISYCFAWCVYREAGGFYCRCRCFAPYVLSRSRRLVSE